MPHIPLGASEAFKGKSDAGPYGDAVEELDWSTGEVLRTIGELGLDEQTLVVFTSDNGPWIETTAGNIPSGRPLIPRDHSGSADPLRGYKMTTWDGGLRVPCIIRSPGYVSAGSSSDEVASTIDFLPTFARLAGTAIPSDRILDGRDIRPLLTGDPSANKLDVEFYFFCYTHLQAVRSGRWKLVLPRPEHPAWVGWSGRFHGNDVSQTELYDVQNDVSEQHDVAHEHPEVVSRLMKLIVQARQQIGDYDTIGDQARFYDNGPRRPEIVAPNEPKQINMPKPEVQP